MTTFIDGPAQGEVFYLERAPLFLRVTQNGLAFRGLDQFADEPDYTEIIYAYQRISKPTGNIRKGDRDYPVAQYRFVQPQPRDGLIRETHAWRGWTQRQVQDAC